MQTQDSGLGVFYSRFYWGNKQIIISYLEFVEIPVPNDRGNWLSDKLAQPNFICFESLLPPLATKS